MRSTKKLLISTRDSIIIMTMMMMMMHGLVGDIKKEKKLKLCKLNQQPSH